MRALLLILAGLGLIADAGRAAAADDVITINAAGSSFISPLMQKLGLEYNRLHPDVKINYQSTGSGTGIHQFSDQTIDFACVDFLLTNRQMKAGKGGAVVQIPLALGAVVPICHVEGVPAEKPLVFSGPLLADIFDGKIKNWNDAAIKKLNPEAKLPDADITVVHRSDGSGTTYVLTNYLSLVSPEFAKNPGKGISIQWPAPNKIGAKGCEGISAIIQKTPNTIGYVEMIYALANQVSYSPVINASGKTLQASLKNVTAAAANQKELPADSRKSILNAPGEDAYPISSFTYLVAYKNQTDSKRGRALAEFLKWAVTDGQKLAAEMNYAPVPENVVKADLKMIDSIAVK